MTYPNIDPVILDLGFAKIYWYGLMYIFAFISAYFLAKNRIKKSSQWKLNELEDLIFYGAIGVVLGGRLGYMFFYNLSDFISNPAIIFEIQNGGMSFHGGLLGVIISMILFNRKYKREFFTTMDFVAPLVPLGLGFGRIGNFINGELWGKVSSSSYAMFIPQENISRYPTQLYELEDLIFYGAIGVVLGGRLGYMFFYNLSDFISNPAIIFEIQNGGMSFHGGLLGVIISMVLFNRKYKRDFFITMDFVAPLVPLGLGFGRIGNFINGELWGKVSSSSYAMFIPQENISRYPTQLYEAFLEGLILFVILWLYSSKERSRMSTSALFLIFYGLFRFIIEFVREPDQHIGYLAFDWITMGQVLSFPMILLGVYLFMKSNKNASIS